MTKAHQYAPLHPPDTEINGCRRSPSISRVRSDHHAGPSTLPDCAKPPSLLKAFCRPLHQWPCLEVRDKDAAQPKDMRPVCRGRGSLRVWDDIRVCVSGPWEKSHFPFLGHVTYGICISGSGSPNLSQVTAGIRGLQTAWKKLLVQMKVGDLQ